MARKTSAIHLKNVRHAVKSHQQNIGGMVLQSKYMTIKELVEKATDDLISSK